MTDLINEVIYCVALILIGVLILAFARLSWEIGWYLVDKWNER